MHVCHLKNSNEYKGRVVFRGGVVKDDSDSHVVFTEQESSASHVTVAKVLDVIVKLLWAAGQASEFVSACTQGKTEDAPKLLQRSEIKCAVDISDQKIWKLFKILLLLLELMCSHTSWQDYFGRDSSKRFSSKTDVRKLQSGTVSSCIDNKDYFFPFSWTIWRWQDNLDLMCKRFMKRVDLENQRNKSQRDSSKFQVDTRLLCRMTGRWWWTGEREDVSLENNTNHTSKEEGEQNSPVWIIERNTDGSASESPSEFASSRFLTSIQARSRVEAAELTTSLRTPSPNRSRCHSSSKRGIRDGVRISGTAGDHEWGVMTLFWRERGDSSSKVVSNRQMHFRIVDTRVVSSSVTSEDHVSCWVVGILVHWLGACCVTLSFMETFGSTW